MCGIIGLYDFKGIDSEKFEYSLKKIEHRGPDNQSVEIISDKLVFGHTRLAIIDLDHKSNQPFSLQNNYTVTYNGEIFNYKELREELVKKGFQFNTQSDTEVLLTSYICWGEDCVKKFNGMWSFAIFDKVKNKIFCSRDRYGIKPFYYVYNENIFMFSSMISPILSYYKEFNNPDFKSINDFLYRGFSSQYKNTWFKKIKKLTPGHNIVFDFDSLNEINYYSSSFNTKFTPFSKVKEKFKNLIYDSVRLRLRSDVEISSTLTTGLDSSTLVSIINETSHKKLNTYTVFSKNSSFTKNDSKIFKGDINLDESSSIDFFSGEKLNSTLIELNTINYLNDLIYCIKYLETGHASPAIVAMKQLYKKTNEDGIKVLIEGQGADEILGGYLVDLVPEIIKNNIFSPRKLLKVLKKITEVYSLKQVVLRSLNRLKINNLFVLIKMSLTRVKITTSKNFLTPDKFLNIFDFQQREVLPNLLSYGDALSMSYGIETRLPFLDYRVFDYVNNLPLNYKVSNAKGKYLLRESMKNILPNDIYSSKIKNGFSIPIDKILKEEKKIKHILYKPQGYNYFNEKKLKKLLDEYYSGSFNNESFIFKILTIRIWFLTFFENEL